jgi:xanthine dehydrogenase iron-sulfur cluster and FAD-binding subunit A
VVEKARVSFGGVAPTTVRLLALEKSLAGQKPSAALVSEGRRMIAALIKPISDARGHQKFRTVMAQNLFEKYLSENFSL